MYTTFIKNLQICGKSGDVQGPTVDSWKEWLPEISHARSQKIKTYKDANRPGLEEVYTIILFLEQEGHVEEALKLGSQGFVFTTKQTTLDLGSTDYHASNCLTKHAI